VEKRTKKFKVKICLREEEPAQMKRVQNVDQMQRLSRPGDTKLVPGKEDLIRARSVQ